MDAITKEELIEFEEEVGRRFDAGDISGPVHLNSSTQADHLIRIFHEVRQEDWILSTWRSHWHALLKGVPKEKVMAEILAGRSMMLHFPEYRFMTSAMVGGMVGIACGLAAGGEKVWCFVGDMTASIGNFHDALKYSHGHGLGVNFIVEDNGLSTNTPTWKTWGTTGPTPEPRRYEYTRTTNHYGTKNFVSF